MTPRHRTFPAQALVMGTLCSVLLLCACSNVREEDNGPRDDAPAFDRSRALLMGRMMLYSYQQLTDFANGTAFTLPEGFTLHAELITYEWFSANTTMIGDDPTPIVFIATNDDNEDILVIFRGSITPSEWLDDVTFAQRDFSDIVPDASFVHEGFGDVYRSVRDDLFDTLTTLVDERASPAIWIGGHSLGGSLSVLAAIDIAENLNVTPSLYTYAGPRVGDLDFQQAYRNRVADSWRIINEHDLVPRFPPRSSAVTRGETRELRRYAHVNAEHLLTFGVSIYAPAQSASDAGLDLDLTTPVDLDAQGVDWSAPTVIQNHGVCFYFNHLCEAEPDPASCRLTSDGRDGCNADEVDAAINGD